MVTLGLDTIGVVRLSVIKLVRLSIGRFGKVPLG